MLTALFGALALAPFYWLLAPARHRRDLLAAASLCGLAVYDPRLVFAVVGLTLLLFAATFAIASGGRGRARVILIAGLALLAALFIWNKLGLRAPGRSRPGPASRFSVFPIWHSSSRRR